jgi:hypothetical protein
MESVRGWAASNGLTYEFVDDRLFGYAPAWYRAKVADNKLLVADLARLELARELLGRYERVIWVDADMLIFDPQPATFRLEDGYAFCREVWLWRKPGGELLVLPDRVNNSICVFERGNRVLDFLIHAAQALVRNSASKVRPVQVSTEFLSGLNAAMGLPLLRHVGMLSPYVIGALVAEDAALLQAYMAKVGEPLFAANLCASFRDPANHGSTLEEHYFERATEKLLATRGAALNRYLTGVATGLPFSTM